MASLQQTKSNIMDGTTPIRGVNLGGWLVAEQWMSWKSPIWTNVPQSVYTKGEYQTMKYIGHKNGDVLFKKHRDTYVTEKEFADIALAGLNCVRIPVGHWIMGQDNAGGTLRYDWKMYAPGALYYLDKAVKEWAPKYGLTVLISVHAARGSQNGYDHSSPSQSQGVWSAAPENVTNTLQFVDFLVTRYGNDPAFLGIGLLNEPGNGANKTVLLKYYQDAYNLVRNQRGSTCLLTHAPMVWEQTTQAPDWASFMTDTNTLNTCHEWHRYQVWGFENKTVYDLVDWCKNDLMADVTSWPGKPLLIGEWSMALSDTITSNNMDAFKQYGVAQLDAFRQAKAGWFFWNWKVDGDGNGTNGWSLRDMIASKTLVL